MIVDLFLVYQFIRRLATPFNKWDAFKLGVIDKDGKVLIKSKDFTKSAQRKSWGVFDRMVANLKKLLAKVPGGSSRFASYAAALFLIKEYKHFTDKTTLTEELTDKQLDESIQLFYSRYNHYTTLVEDVNGLNEKAEHFLEKLEEAAAPRWKRAGTNGEIEATIGGKKYKIEKALDSNERHKGEWKVMVWDKRDWEWETTEYGKANAKAWIMDRLKEDTPVNNVGDGNIAGMDGTAMSKAAQKKWTSKNKTKKRKTLRNIINGDTL